MKIVLERSQASLDIEKPGREVNGTRFVVLPSSKTQNQRLLRKVSINVGVSRFRPWRKAYSSEHDVWILSDG